jgi:membrane protein DedA with SNARE-associated domain
LATIIDLLQNLSIVLRSGQLPEWGLWTYLVLAILVAIEGPIVTLLGAAAASTGLMRPGLVFIAASIGNLSADTLWYSLGYLGKIEWLLHFGRRMGISHEQLDRMEQTMHKHAAKVLFFAKLSVSLVIPSLVAAGLIKVRWRSWFPALASAEMIWTGSLVLIGYHATRAAKSLERGLDYAILAGTVLFVFFLLWLGRRILRASNIDGGQINSDQDQTRKEVN